jgi:hypothetical protein
MLPHYPGSTDSRIRDSLVTDRLQPSVPKQFLLFPTGFTPDLRKRLGAKHYAIPATILSRIQAFSGMNSTV